MFGGWSTRGGVPWYNPTPVLWQKHTVGVYVLRGCVPPTQRGFHNPTPVLWNLCTRYPEGHPPRCNRYVIPVYNGCLWWILTHGVNLDRGVLGAPLWKNTARLDKPLTPRWTPALYVFVLWGGIVKRYNLSVIVPPQKKSTPSIIRGYIGNNTPNIAVLVQF